MKQTLTGIYGNIYDITKYIKNHPGEGIRFINLRYYNRKEASDSFSKAGMLTKANSKENMMVIQALQPLLNEMMEQNDHGKKSPVQGEFQPQQPYDI